MRDFFEAPQALREEREAERGLNWFLEFLVFILVFVVCTFGELMIMLPTQMVMLYSNENYLEAAAAMDLGRIMEVTTEIVSSNAYSILTLFSNIMMIVVALLFCRIIQKRSFASVGFVSEKAPREYLVGAVVGFVMFSAAVLICVLTGTLQFQGFSKEIQPVILFLFLAGYLVQGMAEEVLCRGYLLGSIARRYSLPVAIIMNSVVFALLHSFNAGISALALVNLTLFGIFASICFVRRGNIWFVGAMHSLWNFVQGNLYGISVSGMSKTPSVLESTSVSGGELINGGAFGLEGGLGVTIVYAVGIAVLLVQQVMENKKRADRIEEFV